MPATATILMISCAKHATGTDFGVNSALAQLPSTILPHELAGTTPLDFIKQLPGVFEAIDAARSDPDNLYVTTDTAGGQDRAIWPSPGNTVDMQAGQSVQPNIAVSVAYSQNISLWDYDSGSADDLLGSVTILESEQGYGEITKLAQSQVEGSYYYLTYRVD